MEFDSALHQKVAYWGQNERLKKTKLYVVIKSEYPNLYTMNFSDDIVIHIVSKFNQIIHNSDPDIRELFTSKKEDLQFEGDLVQPDN
jgi:hypothetical protein